MTDSAADQPAEAPRFDIAHVEPAPAPLPPMPVATPKKSSRGGTIALLVAGFIAAAGLAFAAGRLTAPAAAATTTNGPGGFRFGPGRSPAPGETFPVGGQFGGGRTFANGLTLRGAVTKIATDSITIKLDDGTSVQIPLNDSTTFHQATTSAPEDLAVGDNVAVEAGPPTITSGGPGSSAAPSGDKGGDGQLRFGPASDVTVIQN